MATSSATQEHFELEAMRKEDSSWHPCQVSLSSVGDGLSIDFGNQELGIVFLDKGEVFSCLRFRSVPLKGDDCYRIEEGDHVLATNKSGLGSLFYDAKVAKVLRVRHYRGPCRCMFIVKWLCQDFEDGKAIPSSAIMKLAVKSIGDYPTVAVFLKSVNHVKSSGLLTEDINCDLDLSKMLEEQIKDISNSAGAILKEIPKETRVRIEAKKSIPCVTVSCDQSPMRKTLKRSIDLQQNAKFEDSLLNSSTQEISESRSPLSPLAACAALASRMQINPKHMTLDESSMFNPFTTSKKIMKGKLSADILVTSFPDSVEIRKPLISTQRDASWNLHLVELSYRTQNQKRKIEDETSEYINYSAEERTFDFISSGTCATSTRGKLKLNQHDTETTIRGLAIQNDGGTPNENTEIKNGADALKLRASTNNKRFTRSAFKRERENLAIKSEAKSSPGTLSDSSEHKNFAVNDSNGTGISNDHVQRKASADDMKLRASTNGKRFTRSSCHRQKENITSDLENKSSSITVTGSSEGTFAATECNSAKISTDDALMKTSADDNRFRASTNRKRFTRSALQQEEYVALEVDYKSNHETESNYSEGLGNVHKKSGHITKREKTVSISHATKIDNLTIEGSKEQRSTAVEANKQIKGSSPRNDTYVQGQKKRCSSSKKQPQRFSIRNILPRTRSRNRSA